MTADSLSTLAGAERELAELLASDQVTRLDFQATSREQAMELIRVTVESYRAAVGEAITDSVQTDRAELALSVIRGLETCRIWQTVILEPEVEAFVIDSRETAEEAGALLGAVAVLVARTDAGRQDRPSGQVAGMIFDEIAFNPESGVPYLSQCLVAVRALAELSDEELEQRLTNHDR